MVCVLSFYLSGCATIMGGSTSEVTIDTEPSNATCYIEGKNYNEKITTPETIEVSGKSGTLRLTCEEEGYKTETSSISTNMNGWFIVNGVWYFTIIGIPIAVIGAVVDTSTGAVSEYPEEYTQILHPE